MSALSGSREPSQSAVSRPEGFDPERIPTIAYWFDKPISEMPRDELEREFIAAHKLIEYLRKDAAERSVKHIRDLATLRQAMPYVAHHCHEDGKSAANAVMRIIDKIAEVRSPKDRDATVRKFRMVRRGAKQARAAIAPPSNPNEDGL